MKKIFIFLLVFFVLLSFFLAYRLLFFEIGPGPVYEFFIVEGCDLIDINEVFFNENYAFTDAQLDGVHIKHGFGQKGYTEETLREYCGVHDPCQIDIYPGKEWCLE